MLSKVCLRFYIFLFIIAAPPALFSQTADIENTFNQALILYRNNDFEQAKVDFLRIAAQKEDNPRLTAATFMLAKTFYRLEQFDEVVNYADLIIHNYPKSRYRAHAYYLRACARYHKRQYTASLEDFTYAIEFADSQELLRIAESTATNLVNGYIGLSSLEKVFNSYPWTQARPILTIWRAHLIGKNGQADRAKQMLQTFIASKPGGRYELIAKELASMNFESSRPVFRIGIILPVSGYFAEETQDFLKGLAFALKNRRSADPEIQLVLKDTKGDIVETINAAWELLDKDVNLVIAGLEGQKSAAIAGIFKQANVPVIIPVATDNNLAQIGDFVFQANSDMEARGAALAEYVIKELHMKSFATLAPADDYGSALTDAFANKVDQLGGAIVSQQWYYPGATDFSRLLESIRESGFRYAYRDSLRTWGFDVDMARVDSLYARLDRSARYASEDNEGLDQYTDIAVRSIDGFFLPIYEEDIPYIASQFALYNIKSRLIGGDRWNDAELLRKHQRYVNGALFFAGHFIDETDLNYINFTRDFRVATSSSPGDMAIYGYNIMNLIIDGVDSGAIAATEMAAYLKNVKNYKGLGTYISFQNDRRINSSVNILQFQDGNILRIIPTD